MTRIVSPPLDELDTLRTPLNEGEKIVLDFFLRNLSEDWEIYIQPHLNGLRPDFILLNPHTGIAVYEVKHWNLRLMPYRIEYNKGKPELWSTNRQGIPFKVTDNPIDKIDLYREQIAKLYAPDIGKNFDEGRKGFIALITAGVIFTQESTQMVQELLSPLRESSSSNARRYLPLVGRDYLEDNNINGVLPSVQWTRSRFMTDEIARQLRGWLVEPDFAREQRQPLELDKKQKALVTTRTESGYRRIRGSAGSGKTLVLAAKAAHLSSEGKDVLIASFNITLWHYIRDLVVRYLRPGVKVNQNITYTHFHEWCKCIIYNAGLKEEYLHLFSTGRMLNEILDADIVLLANKAIDRLQESNEYEQYDAILVDEGQDYHLSWWNTLRRLLKAKGEMLLVADEAQDLYGRARKWTEKEMSNAGFRGGGWVQLDICYRSPSGLIEHLRKFAHDFLPQARINLINPHRQLEFDLYPVHLTWIQVLDEYLLSSWCAQATLDIPNRATTDIAFPDLIVILPNHKVGLQVVDVLNQSGLELLHIFHLDRRERKSKKMKFFMGDAHAKACTIHSFKGWEARYMVVGITEATDLSLTYVAMSRLRRHLERSSLTVVCSNPELREYGQSWPSFRLVTHSPNTPQLSNIVEPDIVEIDL